MTSPPCHWRLRVNDLFNALGVRPIIGVKGRARHLKEQDGFCLGSLGVRMLHLGPLANTTTLPAETSCIEVLCMARRRAYPLSKQHSYIIKAPHTTPTAGQPKQKTALQ